VGLTAGRPRYVCCRPFGAWGIEVLPIPGVPLRSTPGYMLSPILGWPRVCDREAVAIRSGHPVAEAFLNGTAVPVSETPRGVPHGASLQFGGNCLRIGNDALGGTSSLHGPVACDPTGHGSPRVRRSSQHLLRASGPRAREAVGLPAPRPSISCQRALLLPRRLTFCALHCLREGGILLKLHGSSQHLRAKFLTNRHHLVNYLRERQTVPTY